MKKPGFGKLKIMIMTGLSFLALAVTAISTFAWFQVSSSGADPTHNISADSTSLTLGGITGYKYNYAETGLDEVDYSSGTVVPMSPTGEGEGSNEDQGTVGTLQTPSSGEGYYLVYGSGGAYPLSASSVRMDKIASPVDGNFYYIESAAITSGQTFEIINHYVGDEFDTVITVSTVGAFTGGSVTKSTASGFSVSGNVITSAATSGNYRIWLYGTTITFEFVSAINSAPNPGGRGGPTSLPTRKSALDSSYYHVYLVPGKWNDAGAYFSVSDQSGANNIQMTELALPDTTVYHAEWPSSRGGNIRLNRHNPSGGGVWDSTNISLSSTANYYSLVVNDWNNYSGPNTHYVWGIRSDSLDNYGTDLASSNAAYTFSVDLTAGSHFKLRNSNNLWIGGDILNKLKSKINGNDSSDYFSSDDNSEVQKTGTYTFTFPYNYEGYTDQTYGLSVSFVAKYTVTYLGAQGGSTLYSYAVSSGGSHSVHALLEDTYDRHYTGWTNGTNTYAAGASLTVTSDITLWPVYTAKYSVTYLDSQGGSATTTYYVVSGGTHTVDALPADTNTAHYTAWTDGTVNYDPEDKITVSSPVTLWPLYTPKYSVTYLGSQGGSATATYYVVSGGTHTVGAAGSSTYASSWVGWTDGTNTYAAGASLTVTANVTLWPSYTAKTTRYVYVSALNFDSWTLSYFYAWSSDGHNADFPGQALEQVDATRQIYRCSVPTDATGIIFNDGTSNGSKTGDLEFPTTTTPGYDLYDLHDSEWTKVSIITFVAAGIGNTTAYAKSGTTLTDIYQPSYSGEYGKVFDGWYSDAGYTSSVTTSSEGAQTVYGRAVDSSTMRIYFSVASVDAWTGTIKCYVYDNGDYNAAYPGSVASAEGSDLGIYYYDIPTTADFAIFNDGTKQTTDITNLADGKLYLLNGSNTESKYYDYDIYDYAGTPSNSTKGYYLVGDSTFSGSSDTAWKLSGGRAMTADPIGKYIAKVSNVSLTAGSSIRVFNYGSTLNAVCGSADTSLATNGTLCVTVVTTGNYNVYITSVNGVDHILLAASETAYELILTTGTRYQMSPPSGSYMCYIDGLSLSAGAGFVIHKQVSGSHTWYTGSNFVGDNSFGASSGSTTHAFSTTTPVLSTAVINTSNYVTISYDGYYSVWVTNDGDITIMPNATKGDGYYLMLGQGTSESPYFTYGSSLKMETVTGGTNLAMYKRFYNSTAGAKVQMRSFIKGQDYVYKRRASNAAELARTYYSFDSTTGTITLNDPGYYSFYLFKDSGNNNTPTISVYKIETDDFFSLNSIPTSATDASAVRAANTTLILAVQVTANNAYATNISVDGISTSGNALRYTAVLDTLTSTSAATIYSSARTYAYGENAVWVNCTSSHVSVPAGYDSLPASRTIAANDSSPHTLYIIIDYNPAMVGGLTASYANDLKFVVRATQA